MLGRGHTRGRVRTRLAGAVASLLLCVSSGCVGIYSNKDRFLNEPQPGLSLTEVVKTYGAPSFMVDDGPTKLFTYKVRDVMYFVLVGIYQGHDLVVAFQNGVVTATHRLPRPKTVAFLQPLPWAVAD